MNESNFKLHKKGKILCSCLCFVIVLSLFAISVFAIEYEGNYTVRSSPLEYELYDDYEEGVILYFPASFTVTIEDMTFNIVQVSFEMNDIISGQQGISINLIPSDTSEIPSIPWFQIFENADGSTQIGNLLGLDLGTLYGYIDMPENIASFLYNYVDFPIIPDYDGNPWYDILEGVFDALKVDIFGNFSLWDIFTSLLGISVVVWLLKMLAGG